MNTHGAAESEENRADRRFDGPWLRVLAAAVTAWTLLYALEWLLFVPGTPVGAAVGFAYAYVLAPLATATILLDALSLRELGVADFGVFKWLYALVALFAPPIAVVYAAHREWLKPPDPTLRYDPEDGI